MIRIAMYACCAGSPKPENSTETSSTAEDEAARQAAEEAKFRIAAVASANAASLLCDLIVNGCAAEGCVTRCVLPIQRIGQAARACE